MRLLLPLAMFLIFASLSDAQIVLPLWPHGTPEKAQTTDPEKDVTTPSDGLISGRRTARFTNVTRPTITVFSAPKESSTGVAALVFPGGGYHILAWDGEGLDTCKWLNSIGVTCLLVKYRVPETAKYPANVADLEDAQQAMRLARVHAPEWGIDVDRIGVMGFSAGAHLAVALSTHWDDRHVETTAAAVDVNAALSARPAFTILGYPAYLASAADHAAVAPELAPVPGTPPTFLIQAENDRDHVDSSLAYYRALQNAGVPAEMHLYATGGHGFGMHPAGMPEENWPDLAAAWLRRLFFSKGASASDTQKLVH